MVAPDESDGAAGKPPSPGMPKRGMTGKIYLTCDRSPNADDG